MTTFLHSILFVFTLSLASRLALVFAFFFLGFLLESIAEIQARNRKGVLFNCAYAVIYQAIDLTFGSSVYLFVIGLMDKVPAHGLIRMHVTGPLSLFVVAAVSITAADFFYYWVHRWQHSSEWLWAEHELHHSEENVNVTTAWRHHWLEGSLYAIFINAPMAILFAAPIEAAMLINILSKGIVSFAHLNCPIRFGWMTRIVCSPQSHRIHHSKSPEHIDKNFSVIFPIWDLIFGTYYHPKPDEWPATGLASGKTVNSIPEAVVLPFLTWDKMLRRKFAAIRKATAS